LFNRTFLRIKNIVCTRYFQLTLNTLYYATVPSVKTVTTFKVRRKLGAWNISLEKMLMKEYENQLTVD